MNNLRFRSGQVQLRKAPVDSDTVISAGDLVWLDIDDAKPAAAFPWNVDLATTQSDFAAKFLGVAHQQSAAGQTDPISVDVSPLSVYELNVAQAGYQYGDPLGPDEQTATLMNQQLEAAVTTSAIARAAEQRTSASTLRVTLASAYNTCSTNTNATLG